MGRITDKERLKKLIEQSHKLLHEISALETSINLVKDMPTRTKLEAELKIRHEKEVNVLEKYQAIALNQIRQEARKNEKRTRGRPPKYSSEGDRANNYDWKHAKPAARRKQKQRMVENEMKTLLSDQPKRRISKAKENKLREFAKEQTEARIRNAIKEQKKPKNQN